MNRRTFLQQTGAALATAALTSRASADSKAKTVVLQSAWATHNIGDIGHTPGTLRVLEEHLPQVKVVLWAMKLDERVEAMLRTRFPKVEIVQGSLVKDNPSNEKLLGAIKGCDLFSATPAWGRTRVS